MYECWSNKGGQNKCFPASFRLLTAVNMCKNLFLSSVIYVVLHSFIYIEKRMCMHEGRLWNRVYCLTKLVFCLNKLARTIFLTEEDFGDHRKVIIISAFEWLDSNVIAIQFFHSFHFISGTSKGHYVFTDGLRGSPNAIAVLNSPALHQSHSTCWMTFWYFMK